MISLLLGFVLLTINSGRSQDVTNLCTCDLSPKYCDINCCCDLDCSSSDLQIFPKCSADSSRESPSASVKYCTNAAQLIFKNVNYKSDIKNGLMCIYRDNYKEKLTYLNPDLINTEEKFVEVKQLYGPTIDQADHYDLADDYNFRSLLPQTQYNVGDNIIAFSSTGALLKFPLPAGFLSEFCNYNTLPKYFVDKQTVCLHELNNIDTQCESDPTFNANWFYSRFSIVSTPKYQKNPDDKFLLNITANRPTYASPIFNSTNRSCHNVVEAVSYQFFINDRLVITNVSAQINLRSISAAEKYFRRHFSISFTWLNAKEPIFRRSGNPGYIVGEPILAGERTSNGSEFTGIQMNADRNDWLTVMQGIGDGLCNNTKTVPILFGENLLSGCLLQLSSTISDAECKAQQQLILERLKGPYRDVVGCYGNSSVEIDSDWVPVLVENLPTNLDSVGGGNGVCGSMVLGLDIEILHVSTGSFMAPQAKIIGVRYRYRQPQTVSFTCPGSNCDSNRVGIQRIPVTVTVSFVDVSDSAQPAVAAIPIIDAKLPNDFFYPFTGNWGVTMNFNCSLLTLVIILLSIE